MTFDLTLIIIISIYVNFIKNDSKANFSDSVCENNLHLSEILISFRRLENDAFLSNCDIHNFEESPNNTNDIFKTSEYNVDTIDDNFLNHQNTSYNTDLEQEIAYMENYELFPFIASPMHPLSGQNFDFTDEFSAFDVNDIQKSCYIFDHFNVDSDPSHEGTSDIPRNDFATTEILSDDSQTLKSEEKTNCSSYSENSTINATKTSELNSEDPFKSIETKMITNLITNDQKMKKKDLTSIKTPRISHVLKKSKIYPNRLLPKYSKKWFIKHQNNLKCIIQSEKCIRNDFEHKNSENGEKNSNIGEENPKIENLDVSSDKNIISDENEKFSATNITNKIINPNKIDNFSVQNEKIETIHDDEKEYKLESLFDYTDNNPDFISIYKKFDSNFENLYFSNDLLKIITEKIKIIEKNLESEIKTSKTMRTNLVFSRVKSVGFCAFCANSQCFHSEQESNFEYHSKIENLFVKNTNLAARSKIITFFDEIHKASDLSQYPTIHSFLSVFQNLRQYLHQILILTQKKKIYGNIHMKKELLKNVFHDFKSKNLELKVLLMPEFYSLLFLMVNLDAKFHIISQNLTFYPFFFYMRFLDLFFDVIAQNDHYFIINKDLNEKNIDEKKQIYISLFIRINFLEPLVLLVRKSCTIRQRYRFHTYHLFALEQQRLRNQNYDEEMLCFLKLNIWWICNSDKNNISAKFLSYYHKKNSDVFFLANYNYFFTFIQLMKILRSLQSNVLNDTLIAKENMIHLKDFFINCKRWSI